MRSYLTRNEHSLNTSDFNGDKIRENYASAKDTHDPEHFEARSACPQSQTPEPNVLRFNAFEGPSDGCRVELFP